MRGSVLPEKQQRLRAQDPSFLKAALQNPSVTFVEEASVLCGSISSAMYLWLQVEICECLKDCVPRMNVAIQAKA